MVDLQAQYASIKNEIDGAVLQVLASGRFALGPEVTAFEEEFAAYCGADHGVAVNSGTSALHLALLATGVGPGDEGDHRAVHVCRHRGGHSIRRRHTGVRRHRPGDLDDRRRSGGDCDHPAHEGGHPGASLWSTGGHGPAAHAEPPARRDGDRRRRAGAWRRVSGSPGRCWLGDLGCFSFYPGKNLGAYGEGGIVVTSDETHARAIRSLRSWGEDRRYHHTRPGFKLPHGRSAGGDLARQAASSPSLDRRATPDRRELRPGAGRHGCHLADDGTLRPSRVSPLRGADATPRCPARGARRRGRSDRVSTIRCRSTSSRRMPTSADRRVTTHTPEAAATTTLTLPIYPELPDEVPARVAEVIRRTLGPVKK